MAGADAAIAMYRAMQATVDEVGRVAAAEGIDCHFAKGGTVQLARSQPSLNGPPTRSPRPGRFRFGEEDLRLLSAAEASELAGATDVVGGTFTPHCAAIHPARLARGLLPACCAAAACRLFERSPVIDIGPGRLVTATGTVRARYVIRATEGYTALLPGQRRAIAPVYSLMIATAPLPEAAWAEIGLASRPTFSDLRHLIIYGQRTADGRLAFGGRGAPYHLGSAVRPSFDRVPAVFAALRSTLAELFPVLGDVEVTHGWGGPIGVPRDWCASVGLDRATGARLGGRLRRRWRIHHQPGRAHPGRPDHRNRQRAHPAAVGGPPLAAVGARAAALAWRERRPARDELGRPGGGKDRPAVAGGRIRRQVPRRLTPRGRIGGGIRRAQLGRTEFAQTLPDCYHHWVFRAASSIGRAADS